MTVFFYILTITSIIACISANGVDSKNKSNEFVPGEIIVKFKKDVSQERINQINEEMGASIIRVISTSLYLLKIPEDSNTEEMIKKYNELPEVKFAEPNYIIKAL